MKISWAILLLALCCSACRDAQAIRELSASFESGYQSLAQPVQRYAAPVELQRWDSLLRSYRIRLEETPAPTKEAEAQWRSLQHRLLVLEDQIEAYRQRAALYNLGGICQASLSSQNRPLEGRLRQIKKQLENAPLYYAHARRNLQQVKASEARLAVKKQQRGLELINGPLLDSLRAAQLPKPWKKGFRRAQRKAAGALRDYQQYCRAYFLRYSE
jgi:hypothetical protein